MFLQLTKVSLSSDNKLMLKDYWYIWVSLAASGIGLSFIFRKGLDENASVKSRLVSISLAAATIIPLYLAVINVNSLWQKTNSPSPASAFSDLKNFVDGAQKTIDETKSLRDNLVKPSDSSIIINVDDVVSLVKDGADPILISPDKETLLSANKYISESDTYNLLKLISGKKIFSLKSGASAKVVEIDNEDKILSVKIISVADDDKSLEKLFVNKEFWVGSDAVVLNNPLPSEGREPTSQDTTP